MKSRMLTVSSTSFSSFKPVPFIRLKGKWLEKYGFNIGIKIVIGEQYGRLVIIPVDEFNTPDRKRCI